MYFRPTPLPPPPPPQSVLPPSLFKVLYYLSAFSLFSQTEPEGSFINTKGAVVLLRPGPCHAFCHTLHHLHEPSQGLTPAQHN